MLSVLGSMSAQRAQGLSSLTRRHAVKVASAVSVEACCLAVGEVVGLSSVLSASRMNNAIVVFLDSVDKANELVERGIVVDGEFISVLPLSLPAKKVTLSNVPPFVSDEILTQALTRYGKLVSPIKKIPISSQSPLLKHIVSFRRFVYMIIPDDADLDLTLNFRIDDFSYAIFVSTGKVKCLGCGHTGHLVRNCPNKNNEEGDRSKGETGENRKESEVEIKAVVSAVMKKVVDSTVEAETQSGFSQTENAGVNSNVLPGNIGARVADTLVPPLEGERIRRGEGSQNCEMDMEAQLELEQEQLCFKTPQKRKMKSKSLEAKVSRTGVDQNENMIDTESDSDSSESSVTLSQGEFTTRSYGLEDIKLFLRSTKNKRGVKVQEYFPDLRQFVEQAKLLMARDSFTNKEVYRLKKIVRNVNSTLINDGV